MLTSPNIREWGEIPKPFPVDLLVQGEIKAGLNFWSWIPNDRGKAHVAEVEEPEMTLTIDDIARDVIGCVVTSQILVAQVPFDYSGGDYVRIIDTEEGCWAQAPQLKDQGKLRRLQVLALKLMACSSL